MISPTMARILRIVPEKYLIKIAKGVATGYIKKHANLHIEGMENIDKAQGAKLFIGNHLSNSDGLILDYLLRAKYDPTFVAGVKLTDDPVTSLGTKIVKHIAIKPNSADKEAISNMVKIVKRGESLLMFPEGTRSRTGAMIEAKKGILLMARVTKAPIIPIAMWGTEKLLPINEDGDMSHEKWYDADVYIRIGEPVTLPIKDKEEDKQSYDQRCMNHIMKSIANQLPEEYRGVYR